MYVYVCIYVCMWISLSVQVASKSESIARIIFSKTARDWEDQGASCLCRSTSPDVPSSRAQIPDVKMHPIAAAFQSWFCQVTISSLLSVWLHHLSAQNYSKTICTQIWYTNITKWLKKWLLLKDCPEELWGDRPGSPSDG